MQFYILVKREWREDKLRIGVDVRMLKASGIGKVIENILIRMIPQKRGWEFFLIGKSDELSEMPFYSALNVHVIECDCPIYSVREQVVLPIKIPRKLDVFWSPHYNVPIFYNGQLIVTIHDLAHLALQDINKTILKRIYAKFMYNVAAIKAKKIICVSNFTKSELIKYVPSVKKEKISVIYNGIDDKWKNAKKNKSPHDKPYFIYVGNIKPHKNLNRLIEAYKIVAGDIEQDLILVGKKDGFITGVDSIEEAIIGYEERIIFTGYVSDESLIQYVTNADALIFPSLYEGFGFPPLEAMAAGIPVVASDIPSIVEMCGGRVVYINPYDINDIAEKIMCFKKKKISNDDFFCRFNWDEKTSTMIKIIENKCEKFEDK